MDRFPSTSAPRNLAFAVALIAAAMLMVELVATRIFSVLFYYHYSFFAISLIMSGLALGGLLAARWPVGSLEDRVFRARLAVCATAFSLGLMGAVGVILAVSHHREFELQTLPQDVAAQALAFLPALVAAGAFLAAAFARNGRWINRLYAFDMMAAALGCIGAIFLMRIVQGPSALMVPALLAGLAACCVAEDLRKHRLAGMAACYLAAAVLVVNAATGWSLFRLVTSAEPPMFERWNEHSRVQANKGGDRRGEYHNLLIDRGASTLLRLHLPRKPGGPLPVQDWWDDGEVNLAYRLGRKLDEVAVIGAGGGLDVLAPLARGAKHVDAFEINRIIVDYHRKNIDAAVSIASWPEVSLIHAEARVGIARSGKKYDVIQASMIDTWAATANGGFVLSENGIYTLEAWREFFSALSEDGVLTMRRWYLQRPEAWRLLTLAFQSLRERGVSDPSRHIILAGPDRGEMITILVSKSPFREAEIERIRFICREEKLQLAATPGTDPQDEMFRALLNVRTHDETVASSRFDLSPPTDLRPYFFLLMRPRDAFALKPANDGGVEEITFNGVRVMLMLGALSLAFAMVVFGVGGMAGARSAIADRRPAWWLAVYFLAIGSGYIFVQIALHQRLIIILGHPTYALSVVLFSMLLGTGLGSAVSRNLFSRGRFWIAWSLILVVLSLLLLGFTSLSRFDRINSAFIRALTIGFMLAMTGVVLGFAFPLGVRLASDCGERTIQLMWAINGGATIAGAALAAICGFVWGSRVVLAVGCLFYAAAFLAGRSFERLDGCKDLRRKDR